MRRFHIPAICLIVLAACKADEVEVDLTIDDILAAAAGEVRTVEFTAVFSTYGDLDDEERAQVNAIEQILGRYVSVDDFELLIEDNGYEVTIEGELPLSNDPYSSAAYYVLVSPSTSIPGSLRVQMATGQSFDRMSQEMSGISFLLAPDAFHPTQFRLNADGHTVFAPAVQVDGEYHLMWSEALSNRVRLNFGGGAYDEIGAGFFIR